jgi:hypothetical protein
LNYPNSPLHGIAALPKRLIICLDGISYRDMKALQAGVTYKDTHGFQFHRQAFHQGYFPVSRMISTFPSTSDVAWTDIFGDRPLPGYQRTYFSEAANSGNVRQRHHHLDGARKTDALGGGERFPSHAWVMSIRPTRINMRCMNWLETFSMPKTTGDNYYAYIRTPDDAQHLSRDVFAMLCALDEKLQETARPLQGAGGT